jgi:serine/threonine protein kinase
MSTFTSEPGALLADRYRLEDRVNAAGGWAAWKATDETLARAVTVLTFAPDFPRIEEVLTAARAASRLTDSRLAQVFDVEDGGDRAYVVLEWVAGDSLDDMLGGGPLDPAQGVALVTEASKALAGAHAAGLCHLCLTPESLHWTPGGGVKVTGLGIDAALAGVDADDPALADTQGLGRLLYATLTGHWAGLESTSLPPAPMAEGQPRSPRQVRAGVPTAIDSVVCDALFQRPRRDRPPVTTPALLAQALTEVSPAPARPGVPPVADFAAGQRLSAGDHDDPFSWPSGNGAGLPARRGRGRAAPGQRAVTTSAVVGIIIVLVLVGIGVGGWLLSHRNSGPKPSPTQSHQTRPPRRVAAIQLKPVSATSADDPQAAPLAIDSSASTFWHTSYYLDSPYFGNLKKGTGLVLDMGKPVKISQVRVKFGSTPGANVQIKVDNSALPPDPAAAGPLPTVAQANGIGGSYTFTMNKPVRGRYVVIWLTKLPPLTGTGNRYQANIYDVTIRGTG